MYVCTHEQKSQLYLYPLCLVIDLQGLALWLIETHKKCLNVSEERTQASVKHQHQSHLSEQIRRGLL